MSTKPSLVLELNTEEREKKFSDHKMMWSEQIDQKIEIVEEVEQETNEERIKREKAELLHGPRWKKKIIVIPKPIVGATADVK